LLQRDGQLIGNIVGDLCIPRRDPVDPAGSHGERDPVSAQIDDEVLVRIDAGRKALFGRQGLIGSLSPANEEAVAWTDGFIVADRMPLGELIAELDRSMPGKLRCDPAIAALTISGVFPLDQPARILAAIARTLPVQIDTFTPYWITLRPRTGAQG